MAEQVRQLPNTGTTEPMAAESAGCPQPYPLPEGLQLVQSAPANLILGTATRPEKQSADPRAAANPAEG